MTNSTDGQIRWGAVISLLIGMVAFAFSHATLSIAIPRIMLDLSVDVDSIQWVSRAFEIAQTVAMPTVGWLGGIFGNRNLFLAGVSISLVCASLAGLSWSLESLIVFQVLQGLGAGLMQPTLTAILYGLFPSYRRGLAVALTMTAFGFGPTIGPIVAGYLVEYVNWRATFYVQIPIGLTCIILTLGTMSNVIETRLHRIDVAGLITMSLFLVSLFLALNHGRQEGWRSTYIVSLLTLSVLSFVLFMIVELSIESPVVNLRLYANIPFTMGCLVNFLTMMSFRGFGFLLAVLVQNTLRYSPIPAGYIRAPAGFSFGVMSYLAGKLSDRFGPKMPITIGVIVFICTFFWYANMTRWNTTAFIIVQVLVFLPMAQGLVNSPSNFAALRALPEGSVRMGSGLFSLVRGISSAFGVAMSATLLERQRHIHLMWFSEDTGRVANSLTETLHGLQKHVAPFGTSANSVSLSFAALVRYISEEAVFAAYRDLFIVGGVLSVITLIPVSLIATRKRSVS